MKVYSELAEAAGFTKAAKNAEQDYDLAKKLLVAYASYEVVMEEQVKKFNEDLKAKTFKKIDRCTDFYKKLTMQSIAEYATLPPREVLELVAEARTTQLFDRFEVAYIQDVHEVRDPDPIVFGKITGCADYFFIAQWGDDVKITDILVQEKQEALGEAE